MAKLVLIWTKLSKGHYEAAAPSGGMFNLDVYEPDRARYFWRVSRTNPAGVSGTVAGINHIADAKAAALRSARGLAVRSERTIAHTDRPVILAVSLRRKSGTIRPPKVRKARVAV